MSFLENKGVVQNKQSQVFVIVYQTLHQNFYVTVDDLLRTERQYK